MQTWTENSYAIDHIVNTDMVNIEANLTTLKNAFSGTTSPAAIVAGQIYFNTAKKIHHFLNASETTLLVLLPGDSSTKIWQYRNDATPGWVIDNSVTDKVLAVKGGSAAYDVNGGTTGGSYVLNHTHTVSNHTHTGATHKHLTPFSATFGGSIKGMYPAPEGSSDSGEISYKYSATGGTSYDSVISRYYTYNATPGTVGSSGAGSTSIGGSTTFRPAAAVGTLQYPDVTQS